jgi:predicted amidohydrolase YtcJ
MAVMAEPGSGRAAGAPHLELRDVEVAGRRVDVVCRGGSVTEIAPPAHRRGGDVVLDGGGAALLPGLHDHHVHLLATAAALDSVDASAPEVGSAAAFGAALRGAAGPGGWVRVAGYDDTVAGPLDRWRLDALARHRLVRVQHRSGALWVLNTAALRAVGLDPDRPAVEPEGVERDAGGRATGRLWRLDAWLRPRLPRRDPDLAAVGLRLAARGVTGVTDATPADDPTAFELIAAAVTRGALPQRVVVTGGPDLPRGCAPELARGPVKLLLADHDLPGLDELAGQIRRARAQRRPVAVHVVTLEALALVIGTLQRVGTVPGDRIEHAAVVIPELAGDLARLGVTVVTSPAMVHARGDRYLAEVEAHELPHLWPCRSLLDAGVPVGAGSDAPFGPLDPWLALATAHRRTTAGGRTLGPDQAIPPARALALHLGPLEAPGGPPRQVVPGVTADLCLLDRPLAAALADPTATGVVATIVGGAVVSGGR